MMMTSLNTLSPSDRERLEALIQELKRRKHQELCRKSFLAFVKHMWDGFINGRHHTRIAAEFENIIEHENGRLIINLGPRHTKSEFASVLLPAWYLGLHPDHKVIQCSVTAELAVGFGRRVRNMIDSDRYREIFPTVALQADSKAAGRWATNLGGNYFAIGVSGSVTGIGANLCVVLESKVLTQRGTIRADEVTLTDKVMGRNGWNRVLKIIYSVHSGTVTINKRLRTSKEHPVYIVEKGWVSAGEVSTQDALLSWEGGKWVPEVVTDVGYEPHEPRKFINFHVSGDNTFVCESSMVHNCIIDDPHDEQTALQAITTPEIYDKTYQWYESGPRQRLQPGGSLIIVMTRWSKLDLTAQLLDKAAIAGGEQWKQISFPAILPSGKPLWPEYWSLPALEATRNAISLPKWNAQYLQAPTSDQAAIVKRTDWQRWEGENPPPIDFILQTLDTAFEKNQRADYSAIATWGIFYMDDDTGLRQAQIILLDMVREKCLFPRLKQLAKEKYQEWDVDKIIVEKRATGAPLIYELRSAGIPCSEFTPTRATGDKTARLQAITDLFASRRVWAPHRRFADELIEEVASFPNARNDDLVDITSMALAYFRTGGFIRTDSDLPDEIKYFKSSKKMAYY